LKKWKGGSLEETSKQTSPKRNANMEKTLGRGRGPPPFEEGGRLERKGFKKGRSLMKRVRGRLRRKGRSARIHGG